MNELPFSLKKLRNAVQSQRYQIKYHARQRRKQRGFTHADIEDVILSGDVVESYSDSTPYPKCLMMKILRDEPTYVVVAYNAQEHYAYIIIIHGYDPQQWIDPWTRRT